MPEPLSTASDAELRNLAILGHGLQLLQAAKDYGFMEGGPTVDVERCQDAIALARERALEWTEDEATAAGVRFVQEWEAMGEGNA